MAGGGKGTATYKAASKTRNKNTARGADAGYMRQQQRAERAMAHAERQGGKGSMAKGQVAAASKALQRDAGVQKGEALRAAAPRGAKHGPNTFVHNGHVVKHKEGANVAEIKKLLNRSAVSRSGTEMLKAGVKSVTPKGKAPTPLSRSRVNEITGKHAQGHYDVDGNRRLRPKLANVLESETRRANGLL